MRKVKDIIKDMEKFAPKFLKEDFDNVGLMVGDKEKEVKKILLALDCTLEVIEEAKNNNIDLIITHHPLMKDYLKEKVNNYKRIEGFIKEDTDNARVRKELIKEKINIISNMINFI